MKENKDASNINNQTIDSISPSNFNIEQDCKQSISSLHSTIKSTNLDKLSKKELQKFIQDFHGVLKCLESENENLRSSVVTLLDSQQRYSDHYENAPVGYFAFDSEGLILSVNKSGAKMMGKDRDSLCGAQMSSFVVEDDREIFERHLQNLMSGNGTYSCEIRLVQKNNSYVFVRLESASIKDVNGDALKIKSTVCDISERKLIEEKLNQKSAVLRAIIDATDFMLVYLDPEYNFVWVNPAYARTCKMKPEEMIGRNYFDLFPHPEFQEIFNQVRKNGKPVFFKDKSFEFPNQPERGVTYWDWSLVPYKNGHEQLTGLVLSLRETTGKKRAEMELKESEERFRRIVETSAAIIFQINSEGRFTYCSPAMQNFGYKPSRVIGKSFLKFVPLEKVGQVKKMLKQVNSGKSVSLFDIKILHADGTIVDCELNATPVVKYNSVVGVQGIFRDVTERKNFEDTLRRNETQLQTVFNNMNEGLIVADLTGQLVRWNNAAIAIHGFTSEDEYLRRLPEFSGTFELSTEEEGILPYDRWPMIRILRGETLVDWEVTVRRLDKDWQRILNYGGSLARDEVGRPMLAILTLSDITGRKKVEKQLLRAKQEWEKTFDSVPDLITIMDRQHRIIRANRAMAKRLGVKTTQCIGRKCFTCVHYGHEPPENCPHVLTMKDGKEHSAEVYEEKLGGYFLVTSTPLFDEDGNIVSTVHVARDITERKLAEEQIKLLNLELQKSVNKLEEINRELERSNTDLEQFVNIASHDLQEPLRTISSFIQLLRRRYEGKIDEKADSYINFAVESTTHMQKLINDLLAFSRLGGGKLNLRPVRLRSVVESLLVSLKVIIEESQAVITIGDLPVVQADEGQIKHLLQNLIANAIKFRGEEHPELHIYSERKDNETVICVQDNGIGIDPIHSEKIFLIFQRLHRRGEYTGTGIGLAICKKIVERHGGRIWVDSGSGRGATFCFTLPEIID